MRAETDSTSSDEGGEDGRRSCADVCGILGGTLAMMVIGFPLSVFIKVGGTAIVSMATLPCLVATVIISVWSSAWLGWRRKILATLVLLLSCAFLPVIEVMSLFFAITISSTVIPYCCVFYLLSTKSATVMETLSNACMAYATFMFLLPGLICTGHTYTMTMLCSLSTCSTSPPPREHQPHDIPGTWDLLCGILFGVVGLPIAGTVSVAVLFVKAPLMLLSVLWFFVRRVLPLALGEARGCASRTLVLVVILYGLIMKVPQVITAVLLLAALLLGASAALPAYLAAGWLHFVQRPPARDALDKLLRPLRDGMLAIYAIIWLAHAVSNTVCFYLPSPRTREQLSSYTNWDSWVNIALKSTWLPRPRIVNVAMRGGWWPVTAETLRDNGLDERWMGPLQRCWENFFDQCRDVGRELVEGDLLSQEAAAGAEPYVLLGLPGVVILRALARSPEGRCLELADGFVVYDEQLKRAKQDLQDVWARMMAAKDALPKAAPSEDDMDALEVRILLGQADLESLTGCAAAAARNLNAKESSKWAKSQVMQVQTAITDVTIQLTKMPMFQSRFQEVLDEVAASPKQCCCWTTYV